MRPTRRDLLRGAALGGLVGATGSLRGFAQDEPPSFDPRVVRSTVARFRSEASTDDRSLRLAIVYFHWFAVQGGQQIGQLPGPALPADEHIQGPNERRRIRPGMLAWSGTPLQHRRHDLALIAAGFDTIVFQIPQGYVRTQRNHLGALRQLQREGVAIPKLVPFVEAASYPQYYRERSFHDPLQRENLFQKFANYFDRHFRDLGPENLVWKDGRVFVHLWWIPGIDRAPGYLLDELSDRCQARYGFRLFVSGHEYLAHLRPDRIDRLFNGVQSWRRDRHGDYSLMPGFFPPSIDAVRQGYFVERRFGATYQDAWDAISDEIAERPTRTEWIVVESANEIGECTSILPLVEVPQRRLTDLRIGGECTSRACIPPGAEHLPVELGDDPMFYLNATADSWRRLRERLGIV
ncbi:MAG TPA: hypothetical protein VNB06_09110 [Thermoanaerobaculia bacterium]|nr:hypothetical protein [Thermoanaerobaculia bacterium]